MITDSEKGLKTANSTMKSVYEKILAEGKKPLKETESPNNPYFTSYEKNYPQMVKELKTDLKILDRIGNQFILRITTSSSTPVARFFKGHQ